MDLREGLKNAPLSCNLLLDLGPTALPLDKPLALIQKKFSHHCLLLTMARCPKWHYVWRQILLPKHSFYCQKIINNCHSLLMDQYDCHVLAFLNYCHRSLLFIAALWGCILNGLLFRETQVKVLELNSAREFVHSITVFSQLRPFYVESTDPFVLIQSEQRPVAVVSQTYKDARSVEMGLILLIFVTTIQGKPFLAE